MTDRKGIILPDMKTTVRHVALFRGINVGKAKRIPMADLRDMAAALGLGDPQTLLNSGNLVFSAKVGAASDTGRVIEDTLPARFGIQAKVTVLDARQWRELLADNPLLDVMDDPARMLVAVWRSDAARTAMDRLARQDWQPGALARGRHAGYLWCPDGILDSPLVAALDKAAKDEVTTRNWATALKIGALLDEG